MKSLKTKILLPLLAWGMVASADTAVAPAVSFEEESAADPIAANVRTYWHNVSGGERTAFTTEEKDANPILSVDNESRADAFIGSHYNNNLYYFKVNSGTEVIFRTVLPNLDDSEDANEDGLAYQVQQVEISGTEVVYLDALVKFVHSPAPEPGEDKLIIWADSSGQVRVTAGRYKASLAASGVETVHYVTTTNGTSALTVTDGTWHRVAVQFFRPLKLDYYNSGFVVYVDGNPLAVLGEKIVADDLLTTFKEYLTDEGRMEYEAGTLFPTRRIDASTQKLTGLGMSGTDGGVDEIVLSTNSTPNVISNYKPETRYFLLQYDAGLESFKYQVGEGPIYTVSPGGLSGEVAVGIPTEAGGNPYVAVDVQLSDIDYSSGYLTLNLSSADSEVTPDSTTQKFTVTTGYSLVKGKLEPRTDDGDNCCTLDYDGSGGPVKYTSIQAALDALATLDVLNATIKLLYSVEENIVVAGTAVTLDLAGRTLTGIAKEDPAITVGQNGQLTVEDSVGGGAVLANRGWNAALSRNSNAYNVVVRRGTFLNAVAGRTDEASEQYKVYHLVFEGGTYYCNDDNGAFKLNGGVMDETQYQANWDDTEKCWRISTKTALLSSARTLELATAAALLGMSPAGSVQMQQLDADPEIVISDIATSVVDARTVVDCLVTITLAGEPVEVSSVSLAGLVRVSKDLATWETPSNITYESTETPGVYRVRMTLPDAANYFIRLSDN